MLLRVCCVQTLALLAALQLYVCILTRALDDCWSAQRPIGNGISDTKLVVGRLLKPPHQLAFALGVSLWYHHLLLVLTCKY
jgi:hypothetical protein